MFKHVESGGGDHATKEALRYRGALFAGVDSIRTRPLTAATAVRVCAELQGRDVDVRACISTLRRVNGLSARQLAALVDVAPTTMTRIESGAVSTSCDLAQEILAVLGETIGFVGTADTAAIAAARLALDPTLGVAMTATIEAWQQRWARIGLIDASGRVVPTAASTGWLSRPTS